ncbi:DUF4197 domain-containing protein [Kangiella sp.]|uniref:DUF4197 domain-containing protein n=1 Tax=Kangiella sp. TaxID=1920245 RepID=UPI001998F1D6|nr:DUF4197 domain-containing protein [Kangiella sp.]MBD3652890.1 DUF4197 domain-containing protein [Kangiella sp.]
MLKLFKLTIILLASISLSSCKTTDVQRVLDTLGGANQPLSEQTVVAGLKQALEVGTENAVFKTNKTGGFSNNPLIKIMVPEQFSDVASKVRQIGLGSYVDKFELQMNRAAEQASGEAKQVFLSAISGMTVQDAWGILRGSDNAATQYFRNKTERQLEQKFAPIISNNMQKVGFYSDYRRLLTTYDNIPFTEKPNLDIEEYVMSETMDGLFLLVAEEEAKIRRDPLARTTELLQKVFAQQ